MEEQIAQDVLVKLKQPMIDEITQYIHEIEKTIQEQTKKWDEFPETAVAKVSMVYFWHGKFAKLFKKHNALLMHPDYVDRLPTIVLEEGAVFKQCEHHLSVISNEFTVREAVILKAQEHLAILKEMLERVKNARVAEELEGLNYPTAGTAFLLEKVETIMEKLAEHWDSMKLLTRIKQLYDDLRAVFQPLYGF